MPRFLREKNAFRRLLACTTALSLLFPASGAAQDLIFTGPGDDWFDPANWLGGAVPAIMDTATVEGAVEALIFGERAQAGRLIVADGANGSLLIRDPLATSSAAIGAQAGATGVATLSGALGQWTNAQDIILGGAGSGALDIIEGARASAHDLRLGSAAGGAGALFIKGDGSRLDLGGMLEAGHAGGGVVTVTAGAWLASGGARFAALSGASAMLTVDRQGSTFSSGSLFLGEGGAAALAITAGGAVKIDGDATFGLLSGGSGTANINGEGSLLTVGGTLTLGGAGTGGLTLAEGAAAASLNARLGAETGGSGMAHLSGLGTGWVVTEHLDAASGTLALESAATLATGSATLGSRSGASASAALSGSGTQWSNGGALVLGEDGAGALTIETGAALTTASAIAGASAGGGGTVTVDGEGSRLAVNGAFAVGRLGTGTLAVTAGASASAGSMSAGALAGGDGAVTVDGEGSQLAVASAFDIGRFGVGSATLSGGAVLTAGSVTIAAEAGSSGVLNIGAAESALAAGAGRLETTSIHFGAGDGALVLNHGETDYTLSAALSGAGAVKVLRGTTILTGDNSHEGLTTISSGATLAIGDGGAQGAAGAGAIVNDGALVFDRAGEAIFTGAISGTGTLTKRGSGLLTLSGASSHSGATAVAAGRLNVAGSLTSAVSVESGAALGGGGQTGGVSIASGGTLFVEGLSVSGDLSLASGSTLAAAIGAQGVETVSASGAVSLDGVALALTYTPGGALSSHYTLVEGASVSGGFDTLSVSGLSSRFSLTSAAGDGAAEIALAYDATAAALAGAGANGAHERLAAAFNQGETLTGPLAAALAADGESLQSAMTALSGESGASAALLASLALDDFLGGAGGAAKNFTASEGETALWARMTGTGDRFGADVRKGTGAATTRLAGLEGGALHAMDGIWSGGLSLSLGAGHYAPEGTDASATGRHGQAALSLSGRFAHGAYVSAAAGFGMMDLSTRRNPAGERLEGDFIARTAGLDLEGGMAFETGETVLTPFAGVSLIHLHAPSYREKAVAGAGSAALDYAALDQWSGAARLGLEAAHRTALGENPLSLSARLTYLRRFSGPGRRQAGFTALSGGYFELESLTREGDALSLSASAVLTLNSSSDMAFDLGGEWSRQGQSLTGRLGVNWRW